jgi:hypothetical protein
MQIDLDTFLTVVYCVCDEVYQREIAPHMKARRGARPKLSDSEVLTLVVVGQWHGHGCERCYLRAVRRHWGAYFPRLTSQSAFNRRVRHLWAALSLLGPALARELSRHLGQPALYQVWDGVPVPLMRRCRGDRHRLFAAEASVGHGGSEKASYYGMHLLTAVNDQGAIDGCVIGPAATSEYWLAEALLRWQHDPDGPPPTPDDLAPLLGPTHLAGGKRLGPSGPIGPRLAVGAPHDLPILADLGFTGRRWRAHWRTTYGASVLTKADYRSLPDPTLRRRATRAFNRRRQRVETVFSLLTDRFHLKFPRTRSHYGTWTRLLAKVACHNLAVFLNAVFHLPTFARLNPFDLLD